MSWVKKDKSTRTFVFAIAVMGLVTAGLWFGAQFNATQANTNNLTLAAAPAATFSGANLGGDSRCSVAATAGARSCRLRAM